MKIVTLILCIVLPMLAAQVGYRLWDRNGNRTKKLADKYPFIERHKFWVQILLPLLCIVLFGAAAAGLGLNEYVFFAAAGLAVGIINGMAITLMSLEDIQADDIDEEE